MIHIWFEGLLRSGRGWLVLGALLLWSAAASARIEPMKMTGGAFQILDSGAAQSGLTEHQVRQLLAAEPLEQEKLLDSMVRQVRVSLETASGGRTSVPQVLVVDWLKSMLSRKRPAAEWVRRMDVWVGAAAFFERLRTEMVAQRVGIDDGLVRANAALHAGNLVQFAQLLDAEIQRSESDLLAASPGGQLPLRRRLADQLMLRGFMAELRLQEFSFKDLERVLELRHGDEDQNVIVLLLLAVDSAQFANEPDRSIGLLHRLRGIAEDKLQAGPAVDYWQRVQWLARAVTAGVHLSRNDEALAFAEFAEAHRLLDSSNILSIRDPAVKLMALQTLFNWAVLSSGKNPEGFSKLEGQILKVARDLVRMSPSRADSWLALAISELLSGTVAMSSGKMAQAERHVENCLKALDKHAKLTNVVAEVSQIRLYALTMLSYFIAQKEAWVELLAILKPVEGLATELNHGSEKTPAMDDVLYSVHAHRALAYSSLGRKDEGLASLGQVLEITERHLGEVSEAMDWEFAGWRAHVGMAVLLTGSKSPERLLRHRKRAAEIARNAVVRKPGHPDWEERYWDSVHELGEMLNEAGDTSGAFEAAKESLKIAQRNATGSGTESQWSRKVFRSLWELGTIELDRGDGQNAMEHSEAAARVARDRYALDASAEFVLNDRWLIENRLGSIRSSLGDDHSARQSHQVALSVAQEALKSEPNSDDWIENAAQSHERIARIFNDRQDWGSSLQHSQAGAVLAGRRLAATEVNFEVLRGYWLHQFNVGRMHLKLKEHGEARAALTLARDLVRRHWHRFSGEELWQDSRWFNEQEFGHLEESEGSLGNAEVAYARAASIAEESRTGSDDVLRVWLARAVESLESQVRVQSAQGNMDALRRSSLLATRYRDLQAAEHRNNRRIDARKAISFVLADLDLSLEQAQAMPRADLMERLQQLIDATRDTTRAKGMTGERSERILRMQNALFAVRHLLD